MDGLSDGGLEVWDEWNNGWKFGDVGWMEYWMEDWDGWKLGWRIGGLGWNDNWMEDWRCGME